MITQHQVKSVGKVIKVTDKLSAKQFERLARIVGMLTDAMVAGFYGSFEFKLENGNPLPHVPVKESKELYETK